MKEVKTILEFVSEIITPNPQELMEEKEFAKKLIERLKEELEEEAEIKFVGSAARDTGLRGDRDIDLFVTFPKNRSREEIMEITFSATKKAIPAKWILRYAEHPYLQAIIKEFKVEVIPCYSMKPHEEIQSAVDRSPLHMDYLQKKITENQKKDVRILKQFMKNAGIYGAEIEVEGFSGLVCEYLILNYRSFENLIKEASNWKPPVVIDIEGIYEEEGREFLLKKFPESPLILIDVIDKKRNTAASVSLENFSRFVVLCREFLNKPSLKFFFRKRELFGIKKIFEAIEKRETALFLLLMNKPNVIEDVLIPQLRKSERAIANHLEKEGFKVFGSNSFVSGKELGILIELENETLPKIKKVKGPLVWEKEGCKKFVSKHIKPIKGPYIEEDRLVIEEERKERKAKNFIKKIFKKPRSFGIASKIAKKIGRAKLLQKKEFNKINREVIEKIGEYIFKKEFFY